RYRIRRRPLKRPVSVPNERAHTAGIPIVDHEVQRAVAIQIGVAHLEWVHSGREGLAGLKGAVAISEQHVYDAELRVRNDQVQLSVAIEVVGLNGAPGAVVVLRTGSQGVVHAWGEGAIAQTQVDAQLVADLVLDGKIGNTVGVQVHDAQANWACRRSNLRRRAESAVAVPQREVDDIPPWIDSRKVVFPIAVEIANGQRKGTGHADFIACAQVSGAISQHDVDWLAGRVPEDDIRVAVAVEIADKDVRRVETAGISDLGPERPVSIADEHGDGSIERRISGDQIQKAVFIQIRDRNRNRKVVGRINDCGEEPVSRQGIHGNRNGGGSGWKIACVAGIVGVDRSYAWEKKRRLEDSRPAGD